MPPLLGAPRAEHLNNLRGVLRQEVSRLSVKHAGRISLYEFYAALVKAVEDNARAPAAELVHRGDALAAEYCREGTRNG